MKLKIISILFISGIFIFYLGACSETGEYKNTTDDVRPLLSEPLKGIDEIGLRIILIDKKARIPELAKDRLKTVTELRLRREGIRIAEVASPDYPEFIVDIDIAGAAFNICLSTQEYVILHRDKSIKCYAQTWSHLATGTHINNPEQILSNLSNLLDIFLNDYYKANPKKKDH